VSTETSAKITIVGVGLVGGSIGLAIRRAGLERLRVVGYDKNHDTLRTAEKIGAIDEQAHDLGGAVRDAALVVLAVPIEAMRDTLTALARHLTPETVVTDTASTKGEVMRWARELLPEGASFVGGHPMGGKEDAGIEHAEATLFDGKAWVITPTVDASPSAIRSVTGLARICGAETLHMDPEEHDQYAAAISHMPLFTSTALFTLARSSASWDDLGAMAGPAFRDLTRLASGDPGLALGIWRTNREAVIHWIERMMAELGRYRNMLQDAQDEQLLQAFAEAQLQRDEFIAHPPQRQPVETEKVDQEKAVLDMLVGGIMADKLRKAQKIPEMMRERPELTEDEEKQGVKKLSTAERIAEGVRRDLEKLEAEREAKEQKKREREQ
jgi:prephenate dehydrogenase